MQTSLSSATLLRLKLLPVQLPSSSPLPCVLELGPELFLSPYCSYFILHLSRNGSFNRASSSGSITKWEDEGPGFFSVSVFSVLFGLRNFKPAAYKCFLKASLPIIYITLIFMGNKSLPRLKKPLWKSSESCLNNCKWALLPSTPPNKEGSQE